MDDPLLADSSIDRFFICDTWHHIENHDRYLALMKKMLKPGGQVLMIRLGMILGKSVALGVADPRRSR